MNIVNEIRTLFGLIERIEKLEKSQHSELVACDNCGAVIFEYQARTQPAEIRKRPYIPFGYFNTYVFEEEYLFVPKWCRRCDSEKDKKGTKKCQPKQ